MRIFLFFHGLVACQPIKDQITVLNFYIYFSEQQKDPSIQTNSAQPSNDMAKLELLKCLHFFVNEMFNSTKSDKIHSRVVCCKKTLDSI